MQTLAFGMARSRASDRPRTLLVRGRMIWLWPGIALTRDHGHAIVPIDEENLRFWITRLHGPGALHTSFERAISQAASCLTKSDEEGAQRALDGIGLNRFSADGRELMRKVAKRFDIPELDLPTIAGPFLWSDRDIDVFLPLFEEWSEAAALLRKDWDEAKHPRWDAGTPESQGGRFKPRDASDVGLEEGRSAGRGGGRRTPSKPPSEERPPPGIGHNNPPETPEQEPPEKLRYPLIKEIGRWMVQAVERGAINAVNRLLFNLEILYWAKRLNYADQLRANLDEPKSLEELQTDVSNRQSGYDIHHIIEKRPGRKSFGDARIQSRDNLVRIPRMKHREITGWFMTPNEDYGWLTPRQHLIGKTWEERHELGLDAMRLFGVLK